MSTIDLNNTRTLIDVVERAFKPTTALVDMFFPKVQTFVTNTVEVEFKKGGRPLAPFVVPNSKGVNVARNGSTLRVFKPPVMRPKRVIAAEDVLQRGFGETVYSSKTPAERAAELRAKDLLELVEMCTRRQEWLAAQILLNGSCSISGYGDDGKSAVIDTLSFDGAATAITPSTLWNDTDAATVFSDLGDACNTVAKAAGVRPTAAVMSYATAKYVLNNSELLNFLLVPSRDNLALASIQPTFMRNDLWHMGRVSALGIDLYVYDGMADVDGEATPFIPDGKVILGVTGRGKRLFGSITQAEADGTFATYASEYVPKVTVDVESDTTSLAVSSRCVVCPEMVEDWVVINAYDEE